MAVQERYSYTGIISYEMYAYTHKAVRAPTYNSNTLDRISALGLNWYKWMKVARLSGNNANIRANKLNENNTGTSIDKHKTNSPFFSCLSLFLHTFLHVFALPMDSTCNFRCYHTVALKRFIYFLFKIRLKLLPNHSVKLARFCDEAIKRTWIFIRERREREKDGKTEKIWEGHKRQQTAEPSQNYFQKGTTDNEEKKRNAILSLFYTVYYSTLIPFHVKKGPNCLAPKRIRKHCRTTVSNNRALKEKLSLSVKKVLFQHSVYVQASISFL